MLAYRIFNLSGVPPYQGLFSCPFTAIQPPLLSQLHLNCQIIQLNTQLLTHLRIWFPPQPLDYFKLYSDEREPQKIVPFHFSPPLRPKFSKQHPSTLSFDSPSIRLIQVQSLYPRFSRFYC